MKNVKNVLVKFFIRKIKKPLLSVVLILITDVFLYKFFNEFYVAVSSTIRNVKFVFFVLLGLWYFLDVIELLNSYLGKENKSYKVDYSAMLVFLKILLIIIVILMILQNFGIDITGMLAFGGISSVIAGLAAREFLANMFGFVAIVMDRTFKVGDSISSSDKKISGVVESIGLRCTKIITHEKRPIYVPNALFSTIIIQNDSNAHIWHISGKMLISCSGIEILKSIVSKVKNYLMQNQFVNKNSGIIYDLDSLGNNFFIVLLSVFVNAKKEEEYLTIKEEILLKISEIVCSCGGKIMHCDIISKFDDDVSKLCTQDIKTEE